MGSSVIAPARYCIAPYALKSVPATTRASATPNEVWYPACMSAESSFFVTGGTVPTDSASYVARQADKELLSALLAHWKENATLPVQYRAAHRVFC